MKCNWACVNYVEAVSERWCKLDSEEIKWDDMFHCKGFSLDKDCKEELLTFSALKVLAEIEAIKEEETGDETHP